MKRWYEKSSMTLFIKDFYEYKKELIANRLIRKNDPFFITPDKMNLKECSYLNWELGLSGINKLGNKNGFNKMETILIKLDNNKKFDLILNK